MHATRSVMNSLLLLHKNRKMNILCANKNNDNLIMQHTFVVELLVVLVRLESPLCTVLRTLEFLRSDRRIMRFTFSPNVVERDRNTGSWSIFEGSNIDGS